MPNDRKRKQPDSEHGNVTRKEVWCARCGRLPAKMVVTSCHHKYCLECSQKDALDAIDQGRLCARCKGCGREYFVKRPHEFEKAKCSKPTPTGPESETNGDLQRKPNKTPTLPLAPSSVTGGSALDTLAVEDADPDANPEHVETMLRNPAIRATTSAKDVPQPPPLATTNEPHITDGMRSQVLAMDIM